MPSGKQALLYLLKKYSQQFQKEENIEEASDDLRVGLLLHGSTPEKMWYNVENIEWVNNENEEGEIITQGLGIKDSNMLLSEIFREITWEEQMSDRVKEAFPGLTQEEFSSALDIIFLLLRALEWWKVDAPLEKDQEMDLTMLNKWLSSYKDKLNFFRKDPEDFLGYK